MLIFHTFLLLLAEGQGKVARPSHADRNLCDNPLPVLKFRSGNVCQESWQASVRISEGADNRGPDNRGSTVNAL